MKKSAIALFFAAFLSISAFAQSVQEGVNHLNAERYQSAKAVFEKLISANPNNLEATYWLGQTHIAQNNIASAKAVYERSMSANSNPPLVVVGMGHVDLLEGKKDQARQRFESALTASRGRKGDDPAVVNAIARANIDAKGGDISYAISKLTALAQSTPNYAETYLNLGNAYWKTHNGGMAVQNFRKATQLSPALAPLAYYRTARLYRTQENWGAVRDNLDEAIKADPRFAPPYELYYTLAIQEQRDFAAAEQWAAKYIANSDPSPENDLLRAQTLVAQEKYTDALSTLNNIITQTSGNPAARTYRLLAVTQLGMKDTTSACSSINQFFAKAKEDDIVGNDWMLHAYSCGKGDPNIIREDVVKAVMGDSVKVRQWNTVIRAINHAKQNGQKLLEASLQEFLYTLKGDEAKPAELFQIGLNYYLGGSYTKADSLFTAYSGAFPDSIHGYFWGARAMAAIDTTMEQGLAIPHYEKVVTIAETDAVRYKSQGLGAASYLAAYYNNIKKDREKTNVYLDKGLIFDPGNAQLQNFKNAINRPAPQAKPTQKTSTTSNAAKGETKVKTSAGKVKTEGGKTKVKKN